MKRTYGNLKTVLIALLSLVLIFSMAFACIASAEPAEQQKAPIEINETDNSLRISIDADRLGELTPQIVNEKKDAIISGLKNIFINQLIPEEPQAHTIALYAPAPSGDISSLWDRYKDQLTEKLQDPTELEKYLNGDYDILIKQAAAEYFADHEAVEDEEIQNLVQQVQEIVEDAIKNGGYEPDVKQELLNANQNKTETLTESVKDIVENGAPALEIGDIIAALRELKVGQFAIMQNGAWNSSALKDILVDLFKTVKSADKEFVISYGVDATLSFGEVKFDLTVELVNYDGSVVQRFVEFLKDRVDYYTVDGVHYLKLNIRHNLLNVINYLPEEAQFAAFEITDLTANEIVEKIKSFGVSETLDILKKINYQGLVSSILDKDVPGTNFVLDNALKVLHKVAAQKTGADLQNVLQKYRINFIPDGVANYVVERVQELDVANWDRARLEQFLRTGLNDEVIKFLDKADRSGDFEEIRNSLIRYAESALDYLPFNFTDGKLTNLVADEQLNWSGALDVVAKDYDRVLTKIARKLASMLGIETFQADKLVSWLDNNIDYKDVKLDIHADLPGVHKVSFTAGGNTVCGLLPDGADVETFANHFVAIDGLGKDGMRVVAWLDGENNVVEKVTDDVDLHAVTEFVVKIEQIDDKELTENVFSKEYDGKQVRIYASQLGDIPGEGHEGLTYQWYKDDEVLEGKTTAVLTLDGNVTDSGEYKVVVTSQTLDTVTAEATVTVNITPKAIPFEAEWDYSDGYDQAKGGFVYDEKVHSVSLKNSADLDELVGEKMWQLTGNQGTAVGTYTATITLIDPNLELNGVTTLEWKILEADEPDVPPVNPEGEKGHKFTATIDGTTIVVTDVDGVVPVSKTLIVGVDNDVTIKYFEQFLKDKNLNTSSEILQYLSIGFDAEYQGNFTVTLTNNDKFGSLSQDQLVLIHIHNGTRELVQATVSGGVITFSVTGFSDFAVLNQGAATANYWWLWVLLAIIIILNIVIILLLLLRRKEVEETEETATEETVAAETEEQPPVEEEVQEPDEEEEPFVLPVVDGGRTVLDRSFTARLSQSEDNIKSLYSEVKNELLSYKKIRSRVSWKFDSFYKGRAKCVILQLRGKKLNMYIALKAEDLAPKYHAKDVSDKARYQNVPTMVKISGSRSLLYAKQLIKLLMDNMGVERGVQQNVNYKIRRRSTKSLVNDGYIKIKPAKGRFVTPAETAPQETPAAEEVAATETPNDEKPE